MQTITTRRAHTTAFILDGRDYFAAHLDNGGVRLGMIGNIAYDIPRGHAWFDRIAEIQNEQEAEDYFDDLFPLIGCFA